MLVARITTDDTQVSRRTRETNAIESLVAHAFGRKLTIAHRPDGSPYLLHKPSVFISVTHSLEYAALAIAPFPVGIDIEQPREQLRRVATKVFSPTEISKLTSLPLLLRAWTLKEALYKLNPTPEASFFKTNISLDPPKVDSLDARILLEKDFVNPSAHLSVVAAL